jgi:hypothetical protein
VVRVDAEGWRHGRVAGAQAQGDREGERQAQAAAGVAMLDNAVLKEMAGRAVNPPLSELLLGMEAIVRYQRASGLYHLRRGSDVGALRPPGVMGDRSRRDDCPLVELRPIYSNSMPGDNVPSVECCLVVFA